MKRPADYAGSGCITSTVISTICIPDLSAVCEEACLACTAFPGSDHKPGFLEFAAFSLSISGHHGGALCGKHVPDQHAELQHCVCGIPFPNSFTVNRGILIKMEYCVFPIPMREKAPMPSSGIPDSSSRQPEMFVHRAKGYHLSANGYAG